MSRLSLALSVMTSLPNHDALLDGIVKAQRSKKGSQSSRPTLTPPRIDLKQQRYQVLPTITSSSNRWYVLLVHNAHVIPSIACVVVMKERL